MKSSKNLTSWKEEGVALAVEDDPDSKISKGCVLERPKVIYKALTDKFVMWFHLELNGQGYSSALSAWRKVTPLQARIPTLAPDGLQLKRGNCLLTGWMRISPPCTPSTPQQTCPPALHNWLETAQKGLSLKRDLTGGQMARDMTVYIDTDGRAYHISPLRRTGHFK